jgi:hypothetical protein
MSDTDDDQNAQKDLSRTIKIPVQITTDETGVPEIPSIVKGGGHQTKVVQTALRGYCTAHISESPPMIYIVLLHICIYAH